MRSLFSGRALREKTTNSGSCRGSSGGGRVVGVPEVRATARTSPEGGMCCCWKELVGGLWKTGRGRASRLAQPDSGLRSQRSTKEGARHHGTPIHRTDPAHPPSPCGLWRDAAGGSRTRDSSTGARAAGGWVSSTHDSAACHGEAEGGDGSAGGRPAGYQPAPKGYGLARRAVLSSHWASLPTIGTPCLLSFQALEEPHARSSDDRKTGTGALPIIGRAIQDKLRLHRRGVTLKPGSDTLEEPRPFHTCHAIGVIFGARCPGYLKLDLI